MTASDEFRTALAACPVIAVLRGVGADEVEAVGAALVEAGIGIVVVTLNSPDAFGSITRLSAMKGAVVGGGMVTDVDAVGRVAAAGGRLVMSPGVDAEVIAATIEAGLVSLPGFFTVTEGLAAVRAGAHGLTLFPAEAATPAVLRALRGAVPAGVAMLAMGGLVPDGLAAWQTAGADGFAVADGLYRSGARVEEVGEAARRLVAAVAR